ncbi:hypothetical protein BGZ73_005031 [Actinomortierella ambigua]|nr:hypothetical protein BGZ73_005031 [Actinomortierella ambigua]
MPLSWNQASWSSRQLASVMLVIRTMCLVLSTTAWILYTVSLLVLRDANADELYRCLFLSLVTAFSYLLSNFTPQSPPTYWRLTWCISAILQIFVYNSLLMRAQLARFRTLINEPSSIVNLVAVVAMALTIIFILIDAIFSYKSHDKVIREPLLKHFLQNRVLVKRSSLYSSSSPTDDNRRLFGSWALFRRRHATVQPGDTEAAATAGEEGAGGAGARSRRGSQNSLGHPLRIIVTGGGEEERTLRERQRQMLAQQIRAQQRDNWFLSPEIVARPDFNVVDYTNLALDPLPLYEPMASDSSRVDQPFSAVASSSVDSLALPRRPPPTATGPTAAARTMEDGHAPPSYDDLPQVAAAGSPEADGAQVHGSTPIHHLPLPQRAAVAHNQASPSYSTSPPPPSAPPILHGQLPPAYDDIIAPTPTTAHSSEQPAQAT